MSQTTQRPVQVIDILLPDAPVEYEAWHSRLEEDNSTANDVNNVGFLEPLLADIMALRTLVLDLVLQKYNKVGSFDQSCLKKTQKLAYDYYHSPDVNHLEMLAAFVENLNESELEAIISTSMVMSQLTSAAEQVQRLRRRRMRDRVDRHPLLSNTHCTTPLDLLSVKQSPYEVPSATMSSNGVSHTPEFLDDVGTEHSISEGIRASGEGEASYASHSICSTPIRLSSPDDACSSANQFYLTPVGSRATVNTIHTFLQNVKSGINTLLLQGIDKDTIYHTLINMQIELVLTAHPTEPHREAIRAATANLVDHLVELDRTDASATEMEQNRLAILEDLRIIIHSDPLHRTPPTATSEASSIANVVEDIVWDAIPRFYDTLNQYLADTGLPPVPLNTALIRLASWAGGDRDGNPLVDHTVTTEVATLLLIRGTRMLLTSLEELFMKLTILDCTDEFKEYVESCTSSDPTIADKAHHNLRYRRQLNPPHRNEYYRRFLCHIRLRLMDSLICYEQAYSHGTGLPPLDMDGPDAHKNRYFDTNELLADLNAIHSSLAAVGCQIRALDTLIRQVNTFGLSLIAVDIRQENTQHHMAMCWIFKQLGLGDYESLNSNERYEKLNDILSNYPAFLPNWLIKEVMAAVPQISEATGLPIVSAAEVIRTVKAISQFPRDSFGCYIISMCHSAADVLEVVLLQREFFGSSSKTMLPVVPLLETVEALRSAEEVIETLFQNTTYRRYLSEHWNNTQEIMIGYSDSMKDGSKLTSMWELWKSQNTLTSIGKRYGIDIVFFHGRGGSVGRGGGPMHVAIKSQPPGSINGKLRVTVQGEVIQQYFGDRYTASRAFDHLITAVLEQKLESSVNTQHPLHEKFDETMEYMSQVSMAAYRKIVYETPHFIDYYQNTTICSEISKLNLGSRPAKRKAGGITQLRAIPWVFSWTQNRNLLPVWLGLKDALMAVIGPDYNINRLFNQLNGHSSVCSKVQCDSPRPVTAGGEAIVLPAGLVLLREMYNGWPFFSSFISLISMVLAKANTEVVELYDRLIEGENAKDQTALADDIRQQLRETKRIILCITGEKRLLDADKLTQRCMDTRLPWILQSNVAQIEVLKRIRRDGRTDKLNDLLLTSIKAVASGMQNTG